MRPVTALRQTMATVRAIWLILGALRLVARLPLGVIFVMTPILAVLDPI